MDPLVRTGGRVLLPPVLVYLFHTAAVVFFDVYTHVPDFDIPMHLLGGASLGASGVFLLHALTQKKLVVFRHPFLSFLFVLGLVAVIAVVWEWYEYLIDILFFAHFQKGVGDTLFDLGLGLSGAGAAALTLLLKEGRSRSRRA